MCQNIMWPSKPNVWFHGNRINEETLNHCQTLVHRLQYWPNIEQTETVGQGVV